MASSDATAAVTRRPTVVRPGTIVRNLRTVVVLFIAAIGFLFLTRGTAVDRVRGVGMDAMPVAPGEFEFPVTVAMLTGALLLAGSGFERALNSDGTFDRLWADLQSTTRSITVQMYYAGAGHGEDRPDIAARANRGNTSGNTKRQR